MWTILHLGKLLTWHSQEFYEKKVAVELKSCLMFIGTYQLNQWRENSEVREIPLHLKTFQQVKRLSSSDAFCRMVRIKTA